jgi:cytochrome bd-type quinol oxidase subunit 1
VKELYEIAQRQIQSETARQTRLDAKATSLLTAAGLSLTVAFTFGGQVLLKLPDAFRIAHAVTVWSFRVAVVTGLAAAILAVWALLVREDYMAVNEEAVFDRGLLHEADAENVEFPEAGITEYRKALTKHLWIIGQQLQRNNTRKARDIKLGQLCFVLFLFALIFICLSVVASVS